MFLKSINKKMKIIDKIINDHYHQLFYSIYDSFN